MMFIRRKFLFLFFLGGRGAKLPPVVGGPLLCNFFEGIYPKSEGQQNQLFCQNFD